MTEKAYAKINLTLDIIGKNSDGYHMLRSVMTSASLCDIVTVDPADEISVSCSDKNIPTDRRNTCYKASEIFFEITGIKGGARINIEKNIPSQAGLGGGSSDAAAVLRALNEIYRAGLTYLDLQKIAAKTGADVAFCVRGAASVCEGIGELITPIAPPEKRFVLLAKPGFGISTPEAYRMFDEKNEPSANGTDRFLEALDNNRNPYECLSNDLETAIANEETAKISMALYELGAEAAQMTGSGSCVFGLFRDQKTAERAERLLKNRLPFVFLGETL